MSEPLSIPQQGAPRDSPGVDAAADVAGAAAREGLDPVRPDGWPGADVPDQRRTDKNFGEQLCHDENQLHQSTPAHRREVPGCEHS